MKVIFGSVGLELSAAWLIPPSCPSSIRSVALVSRRSIAVGIAVMTALFANFLAAKAAYFLHLRKRDKSVALHCLCKEKPQWN